MDIRYPNIETGEYETPREIKGEKSQVRSFMQSIRERVKKKSRPCQ